MRLISPVKERAYSSQLTRIENDVARRVQVAAQQRLQVVEAWIGRYGEAAQRLDLPPPGHSLLQVLFHFHQRRPANRQTKTQSSRPVFALQLARTWDKQKLVEERHKNVTRDQASHLACFDIEIECPDIVVGRTLKMGSIFVGFTWPP